MNCFSSINKIFLKIYNITLRTKALIKDIQNKTFDSEYHSKTSSTEIAKLVWISFTWPVNAQIPRCIYFEERSQPYLDKYSNS